MIGVELAVEHAVEGVQRQVDAVIGDAALREVVGADLLRAVAAADHARLRFAAMLGAAAPACARSSSRARRIFSAFALFLCCDFSSWQVTTRPVGRCVTRTAESVVLTLWPPGPEERYTSMRSSLSVDLDLDVLGLGQHRDGHRRGVDAALRLGHRHALHAVHAALELEAAVGALALRPAR